ncbi:hypothetical protein, partial [Stutzerimonas nitrititolerans]|uniref:hypothetical protein n=1 Tax=Stutzerimonas nitrititolerans TaxID=2482751 RepID=UPI00289C7545
MEYRTKQYVRLDALPPYSPGLQSSGKSAQHWPLFQIRLGIQGVALRGRWKRPTLFYPPSNPRL